MDVQTLFKEVRYKFTQEEMKTIAQEMAEAVSRLDNLEEELQEVRAGFKEKMAKAQKTVKQCAAKIRSGWELRTIECRLEKEFATNTVRIYRQDTGELVEERAMTAEERQLALLPPLPNAAATAH